MSRRFNSFNAPVLVALCVVVFLPGLWSIPPIDRDEARFAQASRQMADSSSLEGWVLPKVQDRPRINKPPLIYWAQAGAALLLSGGDVARDQIWMYRMPSALFATAAVLVTWCLGLAMFGRRTAFVGAALLAVCPLVVVEAHQARSDHLLLALTTASMAALWFLWRRRGRPHGMGGVAAVLWVLVGLGVLAKGPVTPMVVVLTALSLSIVARDFRWLRHARPLLGLLIVAAMVAPWVFLITRQIGFREYAAEVIDEVLVRSIRSREGHWGPPGYYLVLLVVLFWPGSMLTGLAFMRALRRGIRTGDASPGGWMRRLATRWRNRRPGRDAELFCVCWIVPSWIVFELVGTKLPHYTLPMYPAIALLSARAVVLNARWIPAARRLGPRLAFGLWAVVGLALASIPVVLVRIGQGWTAAVVALTVATVVVSMILVVASGVLAVRWCMPRSQAVSVAAAIVTLVVLLGIVVPRFESIWIASRVMVVIEQADPDGVRPIGSEHYHEDSLVFLTRGRLHRLGGDTGADWLAEHRDGILIVPAPTPDRARADLAGVTELGRVAGVNYSNGESLELIVVDKRN